MFTLKSPKNNKVIFVMVTLALILFAEPILAQKGGPRGGGGGGGGGSRSQQSQPASPAPKASPPSSAPKASPPSAAPKVSQPSSAPRYSPPSTPTSQGSFPKRITTPAPSPQPQPRLSAPSSPKSSNPPAIIRHSVGQPGRIVTAPAPTPVAPAPTNVAPAPKPGPVISGFQPENTRSPNRIVSGNTPVIVTTRKQGGESSSSGRATIVSNNPATQDKPGSATSVQSSGPSEKIQVSSGKTNRIGSIISKEKQTTSDIEKQSYENLSNKTVSKENSRTDKPAIQNKPSAQEAEKQTRPNPIQNIGSKQAPANTASRPDKSGDKTDRVSKIGGDEKSADAPVANSPAIAQEKTSRIGSIIGKEKATGPDRERRSSANSTGSISVSKNEPAKSSAAAEKAAKPATEAQNKVERLHRADSRQVPKTSGEQALPADKTVTKKEASDIDVIKQGQDREQRRSGPEKADENTRTETLQEPQGEGPRQEQIKPAGPRLTRRAEESRTDIINDNIINDVDGHGPRIRRSEQVGSSHVVYDDRPHQIAHTYHPEHEYIDRYERICRRPIWPSYHYPVYYSCGPHRTFRDVYPYYHRKYIFVSLFGYWPIEYSYARYYWYGYHPYIWHGYYPIPYEVQGDTYNYYTYNYYSNNDAGTTAQPGQSYTYNYYYDSDMAAQPSQEENYIRPVDSNTFADVREKLARQAQQPDQQTLTDAYFEEGVKAFEANDYTAAALKFVNAIELAPDDMILPFAYTQALLANEQYTQAAEVLRAALAKVSPQKEGVFYPRGLYSNDDILFEQIDRLDEKARLYTFDADLQLLLGYQLLGIGSLDEAVEPLHNASQDLQNAAAATVLLDLLEKIKTDNASQNTIQ